MHQVDTVVWHMFEIYTQLTCNITFKIARHKLPNTSANVQRYAKYNVKHILLSMCERLTILLTIQCERHSNFDAKSQLFFILTSQFAVYNTFTKQFFLDKSSLYIIKSKDTLQKNCSGFINRLMDSGKIQGVTLSIPNP